MATYSRGPSRKLDGRRAARRGSHDREGEREGTRRAEHPEPTVAGRFRDVGFSNRDRFVLEQAEANRFRDSCMRRGVPGPLRAGPCLWAGRRRGRGRPRDRAVCGERIPPADLALRGAPRTAHVVEHHHAFGIDAPRPSERRERCRVAAEAEGARPCDIVEERALGAVPGGALNADARLCERHLDVERDTGEGLEGVARRSDFDRARSRDHELRGRCGWIENWPSVWAKTRAPPSSSGSSPPRTVNTRPRRMERPARALSQVRFCRVDVETDALASEPHAVVGARDLELVEGRVAESSAEGDLTVVSRDVKLRIAPGM